MKQVSVVVCTKNEETMIEGCLNSLTSQDMVPEIIVVDGHSDDRTREIAGNYADQILLDNRKGLSDARNIGWKRAGCPIVAYCDADCLPPKDWTKNIMKLMKPGVVGVSGPLLSYDGDSDLKHTITIWADWFPRLAAGIGYSCVWGANMAFLKSVLEKNPFRLRFLEDYDIGHRLRRLRTGRLCFDKSISMPISSRRFREGFYHIALAYYVKSIILMRVFNRYDLTGYYAPSVEPGNITARIMR